ncbi:hypothetical protein [Nocardia shimofusensis]|uniref:hypothetical protein n=1 Tax=Nocardia shimofusensis TaxID=228596 RepID=UPI000835317E|nr:hypothetical protein [Nocardia shimofusensis]
MSGSLSLSERIDMLFRALHSAAGEEPAVEAVAEAMHEYGIDVDHAVLAALRAGDLEHAAPDLLTALAGHFNQPAWYLTGPADDEQVIGVHVQLGLLRALRDSGVSRVRLRGRPTHSDREALIESLMAHRAQDSPAPVNRGEETA